MISINVQSIWLVTIANTETISVLVLMSIWEAGLSRTSTKESTRYLLLSLPVIRSLSTRVCRILTHSEFTSLLSDSSNSCTSAFRYSEMIKSIISMCFSSLDVLLSSLFTNCKITTCTDSLAFSCFRTPIKAFTGANSS
ncbi:hypothetical protein OGAPHI_007339 [Ogataea philodendri]|uniref:Uncharacterized protein n=1 Tax=Ogataea philodendri TaxID=1378263 RepID=A0A9P8NW48_9ASCO|nr:uncharacterized protein OGAPHI_007339 [Ogataea philodendri]KAH3660134.1 hypothetical protein OGAPHI_007339 [Ogataea philodendri]